MRRGDRCPGPDGLKTPIERSRPQDHLWPASRIATSAATAPAEDMRRAFRFFHMERAPSSSWSGAGGHPARPEVGPPALQEVDGAPRQDDTRPGERPAPKRSALLRRALYSTVPTRP
ncbi:MAG: hypothetical protein AVDCRST_MAG16-844 [uncultured Frankineae bacterium]|uniref:Uncharacterized protein n=1 Tax=uncultured Frankineae bacterium TaxID=437475 RepID=A0A6J4L2G0_9ACTN|nr:MAG: hypothetical protein AVDCRST_MAG16-844 [uncultured Frankineae bacterium]